MITIESTGRESTDWRTVTHWKLNEMVRGIMKQRNKLLLKSWQSLMFKWAAWSIFGVVCMSAVNWWDTEPQMRAVHLSDRPITCVTLNTMFALEGNILISSAVQNPVTATTTMTTSSTGFSGSGTVTTAEYLCVDNAGFLIECPKKKK